MKVFVSKPYVSSCTESNYLLIKRQFEAMEEAEMKIRAAGAKVVSGVTLISMEETQAGGGKDIDDLMSKILMVQTIAR